MTMTSQERFRRMFEHRDADRVPIIDSPWGPTVERWHTEGMPEDVNFTDFFDIDHVSGLHLDNSPQYPEKTVEETEDSITVTTSWGVTVRNWKHAASTPEYIDFTITDPDKWREAKKRITPSEDRIDWDALKRDYPVWRRNGHWTHAVLWFGFDVTHARVVGTERLLMAMIEQPDWCLDMFNHMLDVNIALLERVIDAGYTFDSTFTYDDMGYKGRQFFSMDTFRELLKPVHKRAIEWAHSKGMKTELHSCGNIRPFVDEFVEIGLDALNPLEVKAGMDALELKRTFGNDLVLHGGINAVSWNNLETLEAEMREKLPVLKENGGYICSSDHSVPSSVSLEDFRRFVELAKELGSY
ncbi:MAG TPA: uroporphyrinogen decarboxylase family protein [Planctomycetota bacterium]|nr:uroporphyrinogen decarboxylase family protein [Planctomycetota bacterium]